ncbi:hypothetical protein RJ639_027644 [Escallonia herrerae]|uniref:Reverse transcriptase Ty1/copia-type domain-containing protein n=1 Tax=Escallonia herrerae TaxID=1293975 RepID=A0AA88XID7_9ASTE|nr:hypothetical protein RJ639_027644 [Escallonia herrerae]
MRRFLQRRRLWGYVSGSIKAPFHIDAAFENKEADWVAETSKIISRFSNTSLPKINQLLGSFDSAKEVWDYLVATNTVFDLASQYQIDLDLHRLRQVYLLDDYEDRRSSLLNRNLALSLAAAFAEMKSKEDVQTRKVVGTWRKVDRLFVLDHLHLPSTSIAAASTTSKTLQLWHSPLVAFAHHWSLFQMGVKNAFLNRKLTEEVYMKPPLGYPHRPHQVCHLQKALYGLKQAPRAWFSKFSYVLTQFGFASSAYDSALFCRQSDSGLEVTSHHTGYFLSQIKYASDLVSKSGISSSDIVMSPMKENREHSTLTGEPLLDPTYYKQLVGSLIYLTVTRPDITYVVHRVSQFMTAPSTIHLAGVLQILRYVQGTLSHGLHYPFTSSLQLTAYSDADWRCELVDRRSTTCFYFLLGNSLIS